MPTHRQRHAQRAQQRATEDDNNSTAVRLDKWLWAARFYKTRELSATAIEAGRVRLGPQHDGDRVKPAHPVRIGQTYTIVRDGLTWTIEVTGLSDQRGAASVAQALYREDDASIAERQRIIALNRSVGPVLKGRPTKRQRRKIEDFLAEP